VAAEQRSDVDIPTIDHEPHPEGNGHLPSCGDDCRAGEPMDPFLARVFEQYDDLTQGLSPDESDRLMRRAWIDDDGTVHVRQLGIVADLDDGDA
jgi:hypothetical protein